MSVVKSRRAWVAWVVLTVFKAPKTQSPDLSSAVFNLGVYCTDEQFAAAALTTTVAPALRVLFSDWLEVIKAIHHNLRAMKEPHQRSILFP
jgi:hypothetical protein